MPGNNVKNSFISSTGLDYVRDYTLHQIENLQGVSQNISKPADLLHHAAVAYRVQSFIDDTKYFGYTGISDYLEKAIDDIYSNQKILSDISSDLYTRAISSASGPMAIYSNRFIVLDGNVYYRTFAGSWYMIDPAQVFNLNPECTQTNRIVDDAHLEGIYDPPVVHQLYEQWKRESISSHLKEMKPLVVDGTCTPSEYQSIVRSTIDQLLETVPSFSQVLSLAGGNELKVEQIWKTCFKSAKFVEESTANNSHVLYLLRDCMTFSDIHYIRSKLLKESDTQSVILIGRRLLDSEDNPEGIYEAIIDCLYDALAQESQDFSRFYQIFKQSLVHEESASKEIQIRFEKLAKYLQLSLSQKDVTQLRIVDAGVHGTINLLIKYLLETRLSDEFNVHSDIFLGEIPEHFSGVYAQRIFSESDGFIQSIESFFRHEHVYSYHTRDFTEQEPTVHMSNHDNQIKSHLELVIAVIISKYMYE